MPAPERVPELRQLPHRPRVPSDPQEQLAHTQGLRDRAKDSENVRLVELLEADEHALGRILEGLDAIAADETDRGDHPGVDVVELAARRQAKSEDAER